MRPGWFTLNIRCLNILCVKTRSYSNLLCVTFYVVFPLWQQQEIILLVLKTLRGPYFADPCSSIGYPASGVMFSTARTIGCWILGIKEVIIYRHFSDLTLHIQQLETRQTQKNLEDTP